MARSKVVASATRKPPNAGKGRKKGVPNKITASVKEAICAAFDQRGGVPSLVTWAKANETEFYKLWGRLAPTEITGGGGGALVITVTRDDPRPPAI